MNTKNKLFLPCIVTAIATLFMLLCVVLPMLVIADDDARDMLEEYDKEEYASMSILSFSQLYAEEEEDDGAICLILTAVLAAFSLFALVWALTKHPIGTIIFDILASGVFVLFCAFFTEGRAISDGIYKWSIAYYLYIICAVVAFASSIWMLVCKIKAKKNRTQE